MNLCVSRVRQSQREDSLIATLAASGRGYVQRTSRWELRRTDKLLVRQKTVCDGRADCSIKDRDKRP